MCLDLGLGGSATLPHPGGCWIVGTILHDVWRNAPLIVDWLVVTHALRFQQFGSGHGDQLSVNPRECHQTRVERSVLIVGVVGANFASALCPPFHQIDEPPGPIGSMISSQVQTSGKASVSL